MKDRLQGCLLVIVDVPQLVSLDNRDSGNFNNDQSNKLYKPNTQLLEEIDRSQKIREYQRNQR